MGLVRGIECYLIELLDFGVDFVLECAVGDEDEISFGGSFQFVDGVLIELIERGEVLFIEVMYILLFDRII
jgi:hypothetical protein